MFGKLKEKLKGWFSSAKEKLVGKEKEISEEDGDYVNVETDDISSILVDKAGAIDISHRLKKLSVYKDKD